MRTLVFGAGTLGCLYAGRLFEGGFDVTILARGRQLESIREHGVILVDGFSGQRTVFPVPVVDALSETDTYELVLVLIRKNRLGPVFQALARCPGVENILFMGNNVLGFDQYLSVLPAEKVLFGFPSAGGSPENGEIHCVDRESPGGKRTPVTIGEIDGASRDRTKRIRSLFEASGQPVDLVDDIDGWLKYHAALVCPLVCGLYKHGCDNHALADDRETMRLVVRACKEGGRVLRQLGYTKRQPFKWNLFYWFPEAVSQKVLTGVLGSKYAEVAYARHAKAAADEFRCLSDEFETLIGRTSVDTPNIDRLRAYLPPERSKSMAPA